MEAPNDPLIGMVVVGVLAGSVATWAVLVARWWRGETVLYYEPRSPVPWGATVAMVTFAFVAITLLATLGSDGPLDELEELHPMEVAERIAAMILFQCLVIGGVLFAVVMHYKPTLHDLGLPEYADELARDIKIGVVTFFVAIGPVLGLQSLMLKLYGPSEHPLIKMIIGGEPNVGILVLATIVAVVVAPIGEEILFRLLLQGWLEKAEDRQVRVSESGAPDDFTVQAFDTNIEESTAALISIRPAERGVFGLPYAVLPIFVSSTLFALAHFGHGPDPIPLFVLAAILGYVYYRTHHIVPCMVAHALFNALSMFILWRLVWVHTE